ncbi:hypothetical protein P389DRAFT_187644 [Cystobasidium minutum MCA 4210]|uniref:uncharacterized protein n=1 Tax=Cystobasidium minutum MCA 4210 TaxID=1397322 RepID=UPI0034CDFE13|eukprot:jgi/Rhomi1/187644/estExt_fgenesh1_pg.C_1_t20495
MAFPSPQMGSFGGMQLLPPPPGMMPPSPIGIDHGGQMQLAGHGAMAPHDPMMFGPPALSAGHPSPMSPMHMQQLQAARLRAASHAQSPMIGAGVHGQPDFGGMHNPGLLPPTPPMTPSPPMVGAFPSQMQAQQAQAHQQMHGMQPQHFGNHGQRDAFPSPHHGVASPAMNGASAADRSAPLIVPQMDAETAAYIMGGAAPTGLSGRLQGQGANSASTQQTGNGEFDMEQEVTVKTKLKGRGTFSGNMNGTAQDSMTAGLKMGAGGTPASAYPSTLPPPYDPRILNAHQQEMYGGSCGAQGMSGYPGTPHVGMGRASTPF